MDFVTAKVKMTSNKQNIIYASYSLGYVNDIMIKGQSFYAIWDENNKIWRTKQQELVKIIDNVLDQKRIELEKSGISNIEVRYLRSSDSRAIDDLKHWIQKQAVDNFQWLDSKVIFADQEVTRDDYSSFKLDYAMKEGSTESWDRLTDRLYNAEEKRKIEYAIGSIVAGESKDLQKLFIFVGDGGTGKSTILKIIRNMFKGYCATIDAKSIGLGDSFALETLKNNPLIAIQDDTDLSRMEDNARLNSIISHEPITINEKNKSLYTSKFHTLIFLGSNKEVQITDARSGLLRRIVDISPTGLIFDRQEYDRLMKQIEFEYGAICYKCLQVFKEDPGYYNRYYPVKMIRATNRLYNFVEECYLDMLDEKDGVTLSSAWNMYNQFCDISEIKYKLDKIKFKIELCDYFDKFIPDTIVDGKRCKNYFSKFKYNKIGIVVSEDNTYLDTWLKFGMDEKGYFDEEYEAYPAQYANADGVPSYKWDNVKTVLSGLDPKRLHYVKLPENHIVIDFDIKDESGHKSLAKNMEAAASWPPTYAELSKSGEGIHLHYIYDGDVSELSNVYDKNIEVKIFTGGASLRRKFSKCVNLPIATINSGLPKKEKGAKGMISDFVVSNEKAIRTMIEKNLRKEYHPGTKPSIDYIYKILNDANEAGVEYDVTDLRPKVLAFAANSTNQSEYCVKLVGEMKFCSDLEMSDKYKRIADVDEDAPIIFYDVEVFPNLFVVVYKFAGQPCKKLINPDPEAIKELTKFRMIGFNCRRYDNHILYARMLGYTNEQLYNLSQRIVNDSKNCMFHEAFNMSYTDVYDFSSAANKKSLKKWEIELGIHHLELGLPWDQPVDESMWEKVAEYCCNDVISTEVVFNHLKSDWIARQILADLSGMTVNDTTNQHTTKIIFGWEKHPQNAFMYRDLSKPVTWLPDEVKDFLWDRFPDMMKWWSENTDSLLPYFPGYSFDHGKSIYKGVEVGEGGYVEALPGMYGYVGLLDVASMHPHSILTECLFGEYTQNFADLVDGRIIIKHEDWEKINDILGGKLTPYVEKVKAGEITSKDLANALKTAINSVYGLTSAKFENPFRDIRNKDNIVAKRGALFMIDLAEEVKKKGWRVAHIKTDSIKIPDIDEDIAEFVMEFGKRYGYSFEWEATYDKMCLVNDAVYIARYRGENGTVGKWTATGAQFAEPYIFKTLFSHEELTFDDFCQTKSVSTSLYLDMNEDLGPDEHRYVFVGKVGSFVPVAPGTGGGELLREKDGKYYSATGAKGYRWLEAETVKNLGKEDCIDMSYYAKMSDNAVATCEEFGSFSWLVDPAPYNSTVPFETLPRDDFMNLPEPEDDVPWNVA